MRDGLSPPVTAVTATIEVEAGTGTFRVRCSSTGGRALNMAVSGPSGYNLTSGIQPVGDRRYLGSDRYTATTGVILSGRDGDVYQCNVTSVASMTGSVTVRGKDSIVITFELTIIFMQLLLQLSLPWSRHLSLLSE